MTLKPLGLAIGIIAIIMVLLGILHAISNKKPHYEGFENVAYPTDALSEIKNPLVKIVKKLGNMSAYFANPQVWVDVYRTSQMSLTELARENIKKEKAEAKL